MTARRQTSIKVDPIAWKEVENGAGETINLEEFLEESKNYAKTL